MNRYIAFAWNRRDDAENCRSNALVERMRSTLPDYQCVLVMEGLRVFQASAGMTACRTYYIGENRGIVIGNLFAAATATHIVLSESTFGQEESRRILDSVGRRLVECYWGRYVAFMGSRNGTVRVLRDPSGAMPCQWVRVAGVATFFSHTADCDRLGLIDGSIHWDHVARSMWFHRLVSRETGLSAVENVLAGECISLLDGRSSASCYWRPDVVYAKRSVTDHHSAKRELTSCVQDCITAWASCYSGIISRLSGGLDSAVVLACLATSTDSDKIVAQNLFTAGSEGDERRFARIATQRMGVKLLETELDPGCDSLEALLDMALVASPLSIQMSIDDRGALDSLVAKHSIEAVFSGQGGDHLFQRSASKLIAAEYVSLHGIRRALLSVSMDTARFTDESLWAVLGAALVYGTRIRHYDPYARRTEANPLLNSAICDALDVRLIRHPWTDCVGQLPAAKLQQITTIVDSQNFWKTSYLGVDAIHPLISQPIIELCLQIPSFILTYGGVDRALVRDSFRDQLPEEIVQRTSKGGTTRYVYNFLVRNISGIRKYLLDGELVGCGILDRTRTESCLTEAALVHDSTLLFPILSGLRAEAWLNALRRAGH